MGSSVTKSVPAILTTPRAVTPCLVSAPANLVGLDSTATRHVLLGFTGNPVNKSATAKTGQTATV